MRSRESLNFILDIDPKNEPAKEHMIKIDTPLAKIVSDKVSELYNRAMILSDQGKYEDAIRYFEAVIIVVPNRMDVRELIDKSQKSIKEIT